MAVKSSYFLAVLLIANPFMLLAFQNCSSSTQDRAIASVQQSEKTANAEYFEKIDNKLQIR